MRFLHGDHPPLTGLAILFVAATAACSPAPRPDRGTDTLSTPAGLAAARFPSPARPVASIISPAWSDESSRDDAGEAAEVLRLVGVRTGDRVADIGAGSGYYTVRLSSLVGPSGRVYAEDIMPDYLARLESRVKKEGLTNVTVVRGEPHDPRLASNSVDVALLVHMYHEIEQPFALLANLAPALRAGARVAVVDLDRSTGAHGTPPALLRCEFAAVGYRERSFTMLQNNNGYLAIYEPPLVGSAPEPERVVACANR